LHAGNKKNNLKDLDLDVKMNGRHKSKINMLSNTYDVVW